MTEEIFVKKGEDLVINLQDGEECSWVRIYTPAVKWLIKTANTTTVPNARILNGNVWNTLKAEYEKNRCPTCGKPRGEVG